MAEVEEASPAERAGEIGDLLFAVVNFARHLNINPEDALRHADQKFERRFRAIEATPGFSDLTLHQMEERWQAVKALESVPMIPATA